MECLHKYSYNDTNQLFKTGIKVYFIRYYSLMGILYFMDLN